MGNQGWAVICFSTGKVRHIVASKLQDVSNIYGAWHKNSDTRKESKGEVMTGEEKKSYDGWP